MNQYDTRKPLKHWMEPKQKLRIGILGAAYVGKTSILRQLLQQTFPENYSQTTTDIHHKDAHDFDIDIVDSGHLEHEHIRRLVIEKCDAFVLVFSLQDKPSFDFITTVRQELIAVKGHDVPYIVVGNKADIRGRCIHSALADCLCTFDWDTVYYEISAKEMDQVFNVFKSFFTLTPFQNFVKEKFSAAKTPEVSFLFDFTDIFMFENEKDGYDKISGVRKYLCF